MLVFSEVGSNNNSIHRIISQPCFFKYNVTEPISVNDLYHLIKWNEFAFIRNNKEIVITLKKL
jgi:hypothetical protein